MIAVPIAKRAHFQLCVLSLLALFNLLLPVSAATLTVPAQYATIQTAINASQNGDTVLVADGTYTGPGNVDLDFGGRNITVTSQNGPTATIIDCGGSSSANHRGFYLHSGETNAVISGLTLQNGYESSHWGGGIDNASAGLTLQNCIFKGNTANSGGGLYNYNNGTVTVSSCIFINNTAVIGDGGGIYNYEGIGGTIALTNCIFTGNTAGYQGGGIFNGNAAGGTITVTNCTLTGNSASSGAGGGINNYSNGAMSVTNNLLYGDAGGEYVSVGANVTTSNCDIQGGYVGSGNINADPSFVSSVTPYDLHLQPGSPCLGAGTPNNAPLTTIDGYVRPNPPSIGAYERRVGITSSSLASSINASVSGQGVIFTVTVSSDSVTPTGTAQFAVDGASAGVPVPLDANGSASQTVSGLSNGLHSISVIYFPGGAPFTSSQASLTQYVNPPTNPVYVSPSGNDFGTGSLSQPKRTIQEAIGVSVNGDTVILEDGNYTGVGNVDLDFGGRNITVTSQNGSATTTIDCGGNSSVNHRGFNIHSGETGAIVSGLTIQNGYEIGGYGGGMAIFGSAVLVQNCVFLRNGALFGAGLHSQNSQLTLTGCTFRSNSAFSSGGFYANGGGIFSEYGSAALTNCAFSNNSSYYGGGVANGLSATMTLTNCTLTGNSGVVGGGFYNGYSGTSTLTNDILYSDTAQNGSEIGGASVTANYCDVQGSYAGIGNLNADPFFFNVATDLHLQATSPCLGAGTANGAPATTLDGRTRPNPPSIGAFEAGMTGGATTTTTLTSSPNPSVAILNFVTFTATVAGTGGTPTGTVTFTVDGTAQAHVTLNAGGTTGPGTAAYYTSSLTSGSHTVRAVYSGDPTFAPSVSAALTQSVSPRSTSTTLTSSLNPSTSGQPVRLVATVVGSSTPGAMVYPTGIVTFTDTTSGVTLGTGSLSWGIAVLTTSSLTVGTHQIAASYGGDASNSASASTAIAQVVTAIPSTTTLSSSVNPSLYTQNVSFTATVAGTGGTPTGTVTFTLDGNAQTPVTLTNGSVAFSASSLTVGTHTITASYSGDATFASSTSSVLTQTVNVHVSPQYVSPVGSDSNSGTQASPKLTIQAAINAVLSSDTVLIADGTYTGPGNVDLDFGGRSITVTSQNGPATTIIDCGGSSAVGHRGFYLHSGETSAVISGLTIQNGYENGGDGGGAILSESVGLTVQNCILKNNAAITGGGLCNINYGSSEALTVTSSILSGNSAVGGNGGGIYSYSSAGSPVAMTNCVLIGNSSPSGQGGGICNFNGGGMTSVTSCTITGNAAPSGSGGGLYNSTSFGSGTLALTDDIVYGDSGGEITGSHFAATYCDIQGGYAGTSNINADPLFFNAGSGDFRLQPSSPCLGAGTASGAPVTDITGLTRPNPPSIGAYDALPVASQTALNSSLNPSMAGQSVTFTAAVTAVSSSAVPTGAVQFAVDGTNVGSPATLDSNGNATYTTTSLTVGSHSVTAAYTPTGAFTGSTSSALTQTVTVGSTTTALASSLNPSVYGQNVTLTATVAGGSGTPTGAVTFSVDGTAQASVTLSNGTAALTTSSLTVGSHTVTTAYSGDAANAASASAALTQAVNPVATTTALTSSLNPAKAGQAISFTAHVGGGSPTGTVTFSDGGTMLGTGMLANGIATFTTSALSAGTHSITASYGGNGVNAPSQSAALTQTVTALPGTTLTVSSLTGAIGQAVTLSATLKLTGGAALSGKTLTFSVDGTSVGTGVTNSAGTATKSYTIPSTLTVGSHTITVSFAGDSSDGASSGTGTLTVAKASTTLTISAVSGSPGQSVTLKATLKRTVGGSAVGGASVTLSVDGGSVGTASTNSAGIASLIYVIPAGNTISSTHPITAAFAGDSSDNASSGSANLTVIKFSTTLGVVAVSGVPGQTVTLSATLKKSGVTGLSGETVSFSVDGAAVGTATTNASGIATLSYTVPVGATIGSHPITAAFAGDVTYLNSAGNGTLTVKYATALSVSSVSGARGTSVTLTATLMQTAGGAGVSGKTITFKVDGKQVGTATTTASGVASLSYAISATATVGSHALSDSFAGDTTDNPATGTGTLTVN